MTKFQNYSNYRLPITMNPSEYGKIVEQSNNKYIIQLFTHNIVILNQYDENNYIKLFRKGELVLEFKDSLISEDIFTRTISDQRFTFKNSKLIKTEILTVSRPVTIFEDNLY